MYGRWALDDYVRSIAFHLYDMNAFIVIVKWILKRIQKWLELKYLFSKLMSHASHIPFSLLCILLFGMKSRDTGYMQWALL